MNDIIYTQEDIRWKNLPYPTENAVVGNSGCGLFAVLHCIMEDHRYANYSPLDIYPHMLTHVIDETGTLQSGIAAALEHFGMRDVMWFKRQKQVADAFRELDKGGRIGVLLLQDGNGPDGTVWTAYGHYMGFVDYRHENGEHLFLLKDSSKRGHNGWYSFERSMGDTLVHVWTCRPVN